MNTGGRAERTPLAVGSSRGVVTLLDVLGWSGIWRRVEDPISDLKSLLRRLQEEGDRKGRGTGGAAASLKATILSISDTIVLLTPVSSGSDVHAGLRLHGLLCGIALPESVLRGIPVRGATAFGDFSHEREPAIFVGPAVDEAAAWHENADWIGVHMTPSAYYGCARAKIPGWTRYSPPLKGERSFETLCARWDGQRAIDDIASQFTRMAPILPGLVSKFSNTLDYLEKTYSTAD